MTDAFGLRSAAMVLDEDVSLCSDAAMAAELAARAADIRKIARLVN